MDRAVLDVGEKKTCPGYDLHGGSFASTDVEMRVTSSQGFATNE